jgi:acetyl-CoA C-acetyltransferase
MEALIDAGGGIKQAHDNMYHQDIAERTRMNPVICSIARTPIGKFNGSFTPLTAMDLGGIAMTGALDRAGLPPEQVDEVIFGHVIQAGQGQITARQAARRADVPMTVPATTINKVCLSGMTAIADATRRIRLGEAKFILAGGMESMTNAPHILPKARQGYRLGDATLIDSLNHDGLWCAFDDCIMGEATDIKNGVLGITRAEQDEWAAASHARAKAATESGTFGSEIVPVTVPQRRGDPVVVERDEGIRADTTADSLGRLRPAFSAEGTVTAGNASQISDGAAAVVVADRTAAEAAGMPVVAEILAYGQTAGPDATLHERPAEALQKALKIAGLAAADMDLVEINEAFASVAVWSARMLDIDHERVNVNGGAVALGHPLGATGSRITVTLINALSNRGGGIGAAALCGGGGQGDALIVKV